MYLFHSEQRFSTCDLVWCFYPRLFRCYRAHNTSYPQPSLLHEIYFCSKGLADKLRKIFCKCSQPKIVIVYCSYVCFILGGSDLCIHVFEGKLFWLCPNWSYTYKTYKPTVFHSSLCYSLSFLLCCILSCLHSLKLFQLAYMIWKKSYSKQSAVRNQQWFLHTV